jgi:hypothetical protein
MGLTIELVWKAYSAFNGIVSPKDIADLLASSGPLAKTMSDDGLVDMIIVLKQQRQQGND